MTVEPVGLVEIAARLGVKPATAYQWRYAGRLPDPDWIIGGRPAWDWATIEAWAVETGRIEPEPPRKRR